MPRNRSQQRPARRRYLAMLEDVEKRVWYALSNNKLDNPYPADDKRHDRFKRKLHSVMRIDDDFHEMCDDMGMDTSTWHKRIHPWPGPVRPLAELI